MQLRNKKNIEFLRAAIEVVGPLTGQRDVDANKAKLPQKVLFDDIVPWTTVTVSTIEGDHAVKVATSWQSAALLEVGLTDPNLDLLLKERTTVNPDTEISDMLSEFPDVRYAASRCGCIVVGTMARSGESNQ